MLLAAAPSAAVTYFEKRVQATPAPQSSGTGITKGLAVRDRDSRADHFVIRASFMSGGSRTSRFELNGGGKTIRGSLAMDSYGNAHALPYGVVDVGSPDRFVQAGDELDPMAGLVFYPARTTGVAYSDLARSLGIFDVQRNYGSHAVGASETTPYATFTVAVTPDHPLSSALAGVRRTTRSESGSYTRELWFGPKGVAAGIFFQSSGRLFWESSNAFATAGIPAAADDLQRRENMGYRISPALTVRGGFASAYQAASSLYVSTALNMHNVSAAFTKAARNTTMTVETHGASGFAEFSYTSAPQERDWHFDAARVFGAGQIDLTGSFLRGAYSDARLQWRSQRTGSALVLGLEGQQQNALRSLGPIVGLALPVDGDLTAEVDVHPSSGRQDIRVSFAQRIDVPARHKSTRTAVIVDGAPAAKVLCYLDDIPAEYDAQGSIQIPEGDHTLVVTSSDYRFSSLPLSVHGGMPRIEAKIFPVRAVIGRIVVTDPQDFVTPPELDGIEVQLLPGTAATSSTADGSFDLPSVAIPQDARAQIVAESLPDGLSAGDTALVHDGAVTLFVHATRRIERLRYRPNSSRSAKTTFTSNCSHGTVSSANRSPAAKSVTPEASCA